MLNTPPPPPPMKQAAVPLCDLAEMVRSLKLIASPGGVIEVRILQQDGVTTSGYYDEANFELAARHIVGAQQKAKSVYVTLNQIDPALHARAYNRLQDRAKNLTADHHVQQRLWLLVDADPIRVSEVSSTDDQHTASIEAAKRIATVLFNLYKWPVPVLADSGNGGHLLYRIDLPNDDESKLLCQRVLQALAAKFDTPVVAVDQKTFNAARISKLYGSIARKGDNTPDRPWRLSKLLKVPADIGIVTREQLETLAAEAPAPATPTGRPGETRPGGSGGSYNTGPFDMEGFISRHGIQTLNPQPYQGGTKWALDCPFNPDHKAPDACLYVTAKGAAAFKCSHNGCQGNGWEQVRDRFEPGWREQREQKQREYEERQQGRRERSRREPGPKPPPTPEPITEEAVERVKDVPLDAADSIPQAELRDSRGASVYSPHQIVSILGKDEWGVVDPATHAAHAHRIREHLTSEILYCSALSWMFWEGRYWKRDTKEATDTAARVVKLSRVVREEAALLMEKAAILIRANRPEDASALNKAAKKHLDHASVVENERFITFSLRLAAGMMSVPVHVFEPKPWVIGFQRCVWDHGDIREHRREDYLLSLSPVDLMDAGDFEHGDGYQALDEWQAVLDRITGGDTDFARTLQETIGYALSGASHLRTLPWLYGPKGTGKSTIAELTQTMLGDMAASVDPKALTGDNERDKLGAVLWGKRLAVCAEAGNGRIDVDLLKTISGGDRYPVRFLYKEAFTAHPSHVLFMVANDSPAMNAYDDAMRDRVMALPCTHSLMEGEPIKLTGHTRLEQARQDAKSLLMQGFTFWAVEGLNRVLSRSEIYRAPSVIKATREFWQDTDPLTDFWEEVPIDDLRYGISKSELRERYLKWCNVAGIRRPLPHKAWEKGCEERGLRPLRTATSRMWRLDSESLFSESDSHSLKEADDDDKSSDKMTNLDPVSGNPYTRESSRIGVYRNNPQICHFVTESSSEAGEHKESSDGFDMSGLTDPFAEDAYEMEEESEET